MIESVTDIATFDKLHDQVPFPAISCISFIDEVARINNGNDSANIIVDKTANN